MLIHRMEGEHTTAILVQGDRNYSNIYGVVAINPEKFPDVNIEAAQAFMEFIISEEIQDFIARYGIDEFGEPLFIPIYTSDEE